VSEQSRPLYVLRATYASYLVRRPERMRALKGQRSAVSADLAVSTTQHKT
jgi:hypothetical protein